MLKQLYRFNQAAGIAIHLLQDGSFVLNACLLELKQQQMEAKKKLTNVATLEQLKDQLPVKTMVALNLSGKGILTKQIEKVQDIDAGNFSKILPNANSNDFYIQNLVIADRSFITVVRRSDADKWFHELKQCGFDVVSLSLGPFTVTNINDDLNVYGEELVFNGHIIHRNEQKRWISYQYEPSAGSAFKIKIQQEAMPEELLIPYAAAFQLLLTGQIASVKAQASPFDELLIKKSTEIKLRANATVMLCIVFLLLLANFMLTSWLNTTNEELSKQVSTVQQNTNDVQVNADQVKRKEAILQGLGWDSNINKISLIDQIAAILPGDITWTAVAINPVDISGWQQTKALAFSGHHIIISGLSDKVLSVNEWVARIKIKPWVRGVELENYAYSNELGTGIFTLNIVYK